MGHCGSSNQHHYRDENYQINERDNDKYQDRGIHNYHDMDEDYRLKHHQFRRVIKILFYLGILGVILFGSSIQFIETNLNYIIIGYVVIAISLMSFRENSSHY